jgi:hypothetical protein
MVAPKRPRPLTEKRYAALLGDIRKLHHAGEASASDTTLRTYWRIGKRIVRERITRHAGYHNTVLRDLSRDTRQAADGDGRAARFVRVLGGSSLEISPWRA